MPRRHSPPDALVLGGWLVWCAWVVVHYFTIPPELLAWREPGELFPAAHAREAVIRAATGISAAAAVTLAAWAAGSLLLVRTRRLFTSGLERVIFELAIGFGAVSFTCLALAFVGAYRPAVIVPLSLGLALTGFALLLKRIERPSWRRLAGLSPLEIVMVLCGFAAVLFALAGALAPETEYDALWYHLWLPSRWLAAGRPVDVISEFVSLYPLTWDLLFGAAMTIGGPIAAKMLHFECLLLVGVTTAMLSARWFQGGSGAVAFALAVCVPVMIWEGTTAYIDLALAWYVVASVYALIRHDQTRQRGWLVLASLAMGLALAIKNLALVSFVVVVATLLARQLLLASVKPALRVVLTFSMLALVVPSPWYARAFVRSGNPVFPDLYPVFGAKPPDRWDADTERELRRFKEHFGSGRSLPRLVALPWDVTVHGARFGGTLGPVFLLLVPVALLTAIRTRPGRARILVLGAGLFAYGLLWASAVSSLQLRFLVPLVPFLAVLAAEGLRRLRAAATVVVVGLLLLNLPAFTPWHEADRRGWSGWLTHTMRLVPLPVLIGAESSEAYLARKVPSFRAWQDIDAHAGQGSRVLTFTGGDHLYSRTDRLSSDSPAARPATWGALAGAEASARSALGKLGITFVLIDKRQLDDPSFRRLAISSAAMRACCLEQVYDDGRFAVYRVR